MKQNHRVYLKYLKRGGRTGAERRVQQEESIRKARALIAAGRQGGKNSIRGV